jgi:hypothetical protein
MAEGRKKLTETTLFGLKFGRRTKMVVQIDGKPFARWILGQDTDSFQEYLVHLGTPHFVCKISPEALAGLVVELGRGDVAHDFVFYDDIPPEEELILLMQDASAALDRDSMKPIEDEED